MHPIIQLGILGLFAGMGAIFLLFINNNNNNIFMNILSTILIIFATVVGIMEAIVIKEIND